MFRGKHHVSFFFFNKCWIFCFCLLMLIASKSRRVLFFLITTNTISKRTFLRHSLSHWLYWCWLSVQSDEHLSFYCSLRPEVRVRNGWFCLNRLVLSDLGLTNMCTLTSCLFTGGKKCVWLYRWFHCYHNSWLLQYSSLLY